MPPGSYNKEYWAQAGRIRPGSDASPSQDNTHTPIRTCGNSALPICRPVRFWITAENQRIQRKPTQTQGEHVNLHTDSNPSLGLNQALWHWRRNATRCPPCHPQQYSLNIYKLVDISLCHKTNYNFRPNSLRSKTKNKRLQISVLIEPYPYSTDNTEQWGRKHDEFMQGRKNRRRRRKASPHPRRREDHTEFSLFDVNLNDSGV